MMPAATIRGARYAAGQRPPPRRDRRHLLPANLGAEVTEAGPPWPGPRRRRSVVIAWSFRGQILVGPGSVRKASMCTLRVAAAAGHFHTADQRQGRPERASRASSCPAMVS